MIFSTSVTAVTTLQTSATFTPHGAATRANGD